MAQNVGTVVSTQNLNDWQSKLFTKSDGFDAGIKDEQQPSSRLKGIGLRFLWLVSTGQGAV